MNDGIMISADRIVKEFAVRGTRAMHRAIDDVSLTIRHGEFVVLLGPSGCGKSTLLNVIAGFARPSSGRVMHADTEVTGPDWRRTVVFQDYALFPWMTIQKNVEFGLKAQRIPQVERTRIASELIALVRLTGFGDRYPHEVSGGMKQRAALARALAPNPDVVLMDEPFGALDAQTRVLMQDEVARIAAQTRKTVLFVTHSIDEAVFLADRVVVMSANPGRIRHVCPVSLPRPRSAETRQLPAYATLCRELWESLKPQWEQERGHGTADDKHADDSPLHDQGENDVGRRHR